MIFRPKKKRNVSVKVAKLNGILIYYTTLQNHAVQNRKIQEKRHKKLNLFAKKLQTDNLVMTKGI